MSYKFFQNRSCEHFPCHKTDDTGKFNCMFCFCPLYNCKDCGGSFVMLKNGKKDCSNCLVPHFDSDYIIKKLKEDD